MLREVAKFCPNNGQFFLFETGQETPITLLRTIEDVNTENLGVNFPALISKLRVLVIMEQ